MVSDTVAKIATCAFVFLGATSSLATDAGPADAGPADAGPVDAGPADSGPDTGPADAGPGEPEAVWTCDLAFFDAADGCDCECGIPDPDCLLPNQQLFGCPQGINSCSAEGFCEIPGCGDGVVNEQFEICDDGNTLPRDGCSPGCRPEAGWSCSADPTTCVEVPPEWAGREGPFCSDARYADGELCDCGCGALDPDCEDERAVCNGLPLGCIPVDAVNQDGEVVFEALTQVPSLEDNTQCIPNVCGDTWIVGDETCDDGNISDGDLCDSSCNIEVPDGWTCNPIHILDDQCDCGCGALDPACPSEALDPLSACDFDECRGAANVDPDNHAQCLSIEAEPPPPDDDDEPDCSSTAVKKASSSATGLAALTLLALLGRTRKRRWSCP